MCVCVCFCCVERGIILTQMASVCMHLYDAHLPKVTIKHHACVVCILCLHVSDDTAKVPGNIEMVFVPTVH